MEPEFSSASSQKPVIERYIQPDESIHTSSIIIKLRTERKGFDSLQGEAPS